MVPTEENIDVIRMGSRSSWIYLQCDRPCRSGPSYFDDEDSKHALVVVPDNKLSLAIDRRGQNVRLAAPFDCYRIDIKSTSEFEEMEAAQETLKTK